MGDLPHKVPNDPRFFTADVHITPDGKARIGGHDYTPAEYADMLRRSGYDGSKPVRLIGCDAASNDFAQQLSRHLDAPVVAPTKPAWTDSHGRVFTSDAELRPDGTRQPKIPPNGEWQTVHPDGTTTKAGDDGFAPGTHDKDKDLDPSDARDRGNDPNAGKTPEQIAKERVDRANNDKAWFDKHYHEGNGHRKVAERIVDGHPLPVLRKDPNTGKWVASDDGPPPLPSRYKDAPDGAPDGTGPIPDQNKDKIEDALKDRNEKLKTDQDAEKTLGKAKTELEAAKERTKAAEENLKTEDTPANRKEAEDAKADQQSKQDKYDQEKAAHAGPHNDMTKAGETLGERTAEHHAIPEHFPGAKKIELPDLGYGQRQFDQIYELPDGRLVVVEAKGPSAELGSSKLPDGQRVQQGRRDYYEHITEAMKQRGRELDNGEREIAERLKTALRDNKVEYVMVKPTLDANGDYTGYDLRYFDLDRKAQPGGYQGSD